jgi:type II secretory pathway pseudopilin PulG
MRELRRSANSPSRQQVGRSRHRSQESGFALLLVLFMMLLLLIGSTAAVSDLRTEKRRQREDEMVWRGNQYVRAIRLYFRKTGHYPQNLDDLQKGLPGVHFLRYTTYKDPMNTTGGEWRFIYVNAAGQIVGSVKYASLQQMALMDLNGGQLPGTASPLSSALSMSPFAAAPSAAAPASGTVGAQSGQSSTATTSATSPAPTDSTAPAQAGQNTQAPTQAVPSPQPAQPGASVFGTPVAQQPTGPVDGPVLGAFLTGVASKVDEPSLRVYNGGTDYNQWEFIWNPIEDQARAVQQGLGQIQAPNLLGPTGASGAGAAAPTGAANPSPFGGPGPGGSVP